MPLRSVCAVLMHLALVVMHFREFDNDDDEDTDPKQFLELPATQPIAEPPNMPQEDSAPAHIHGVGRRDLFA